MMGRVQVWLVEAPLRWSRLPRDGRRLVTYVSMLAALSFLELTAGIATGDGALAWDACQHGTNGTRFDNGAPLGGCTGASVPGRIRVKS